MKNLISIVIGSLFLGGCNPTRTIDKKYKQSSDEVTKLADMYARLVESGKITKSDSLDIRDPWGAKYRILLSQLPPETIIIIVGAGPDGVFHTQDDVVDTRSVHSYVRSAEQGVPPNDR